jgi:hypothetical protein
MPIKSGGMSPDQEELHGEKCCGACNYSPILFTIFSQVIQKKQWRISEEREILALFKGVRAAGIVQYAIS